LQSCNSNGDVYYGASGNGQINTTQAVQGLGGFSGRMLTHGNYYRAGVNRTNNASTAWFIGSGATAGIVGADSSYSYRCQGVRGQMGASSDTAFFPAHYSRPLVKTSNGCPLFKTSKLLGGRSIVSDTFHRSNADVSRTNPAASLPGFGLYHHREGYNVLYGDGHSAWFGDPEQRAMWMIHAPLTNGNPVTPDGNAPFSYNSMRVGTAGGICVDTTLSGGGGQTSGRSEIYHQFDVMAGIDAGNLPL